MRRREGFWIAGSAALCLLMSGAYSVSEGVTMGRDGYADRIGIRDAGLVGGNPGDAAWFVDASTPTGFGDGVSGIDKSSIFGLMTDVHLLGDVNGDGLIDKVVVRPDPGGWLNWYTDYSTPTSFGDGVADRVDGWGSSSMTPVAVVDVNGDGLDDYVAAMPNPSGWMDWWWNGGPGGGTSFGGPDVTPLMFDVDGNGIADRVIDMGGGTSAPNFVSDNGPDGGGFGDSAVDWGPSPYGAAGDIVISGADLNGDGFGDRVILRHDGTAWQWWGDLSSASGFGDGSPDWFQEDYLGGDVSGDIPLVADVVIIPEPVTLGLLAGGLLALLRRRR